MSRIILIVLVESHHYFSNLKQLILCPFLSDHYQHNHFNTLFNCFVLYLVIIVLDNSLFLVGSIFILRDNYYFWQCDALAVISHHPFQIIKRINDNAYELDLPNTYLGSNSFNVSDITPFSAGVANSWTNALPPGENNADLRDRVFPDQVQPSKRMTWRKT